MPDIYDLIGGGDNSKDQSNEGKVQPSTGYDALQEVQNPTFEKEEQEPEKEKGFDVSGNLSADPEEQQRNESMAMADESAPLSTDLNQPTYTDPNSYSADVAHRGFLDEAKHSVMRGVGNSIIGGTGDVFHMAGSLLMPGMDMDKGNVISHFLQDTGAALASDHLAFVPEELKSENFTYGSMANSKFWSQNVAEAIPMMVEFIFLSKGAAGLAKKGASKLAKKGVEKGIIKGAKTTTRGAEVFGTGKGIAGKLFTDQGLTALGGEIAGAVGGGISTNMLSGMYNAADAYVSSQKEKNADGSPLYTEEQLSDIASGTFQNNMKWMAVDMLSWGFTYGGLGKQLKKMGGAVKKGKAFTAANTTKGMSKAFAQENKSLFSGLAALSGKAISEGFEETIQESWEEWSKIKAVESVTGKKSKHANFLEFYQSPENKMTKAVAFALGGLGGGVFNATDLINKSADSNAKLHNRIENLKSVTNKMGTEEENTWQEYHIRQQVAELVTDGKVDSYNEFMQGLVENDNITEDEVAVYDEMVTAFQEANVKATRLNVKGKDALLKNVATEQFLETKISELKTNADENISLVNDMDVLNDTQKAEKIAQIEDVLARQIDGIAVTLTEARQNQANLFLGNLAKPIDLEIKQDKDGNEMIVGGLSQAQHEDLTLEGDAIKAKEPKIKKFSFSTLTDKGREMAQAVKNAVLGVDENEEKTGPEKNEEILEEETPVMAGSVEDVNSALEKNPEISEELGEEFNTLSDEEKVETYNAYVTDIEAKVKEQKAKANTEQKGAEADTNTETEKNVETGKNVKSLLSDIAKGKFSDAQAQKILADLKADKTNTAEDIKAVEDAINKVALKDDPNLSEEENAFIRSEAAMDNESEESISQERLRKQAQAIKNFGVKKKNIKDSQKTVGLDKRQESSKFDLNVAVYKLKTAFRENVRSMVSGKGTEAISQNDVDNYLNTAMTQMLYSPSAIDQMTAVNHQVKRMFGAESPKVFVVKNLFESLGSQGLGHTLGKTVFIDEKSWQQDSVFMHEMSHVYYKMSQDTESTQELLNKALRDTELVNKIRKTYDDYIQYYLLDGNGEHLLDSFGNNRKVTKGELSAILPKDTLDNSIQKLVSDKELGAVKLSDQDYIKEEVFTHYLEGPLAVGFDKHFKPKDESVRARLSQGWWSDLKKKGRASQENGSLDILLNKLADGKLPEGDRRTYLDRMFKEASEGITVDSFGLDKRSFENEANYNENIDDIKARKSYQIDNAKKIVFTDAEIESSNDAYDNGLEEDGISFYEKSFDSKTKSASKMLKSFGKLYNKALRVKYLQNNADNKTDKRKIELFNRDLFESAIFDLASEVRTANDFIYAIENSPLKEVRAFNRYLDAKHGSDKLVNLNSMYFVLSNRAVINGVKNNVNAKGEHTLDTSLGQSEIGTVERILRDLAKGYKGGNTFKLDLLRNSVENIKNGSTDKDDYAGVLIGLSNSSFNVGKLLEQGYITYEGVSYPIETLISGFIKSGRHIYEKTGNFSVVNFRPIVQALVATNRKFTPLSNVRNAEGNMEPVRIVNNHLTKEISNITDFLATKPTLEKFLEKYSHVGENNKAELGKRYIPNKLLEHIYNNYQKGVLPTISQYHGLEDLNNKKGNLYKGSSDVEQAIEEMLMFKNSSTASNGRTRKTYLGSMGAFSDSPRKFFMNMPRIEFKDVFKYSKAGKLQFANDGKIVNSVFNLHGQIKADGLSKVKFRNQFKKAIVDYTKIVKDNSAELSKLSPMKDYFTNGKLNRKGTEFIAEYVVNQIVNGYNVADVFAPNINQEDIVKRFKMNSSPVMSVNNPNFKIEFIPFADEKNAQSGTDGAMYILKEDAEKWQRQGKGVFDMNGGFKFLNASVEKNNPNFKGQAAYIKGYTTIIEEGHPMYQTLRDRKNKYNAHHVLKHGDKPSDDLTDGTHNHMAIAISMGADKTNLFPKKSEKNPDGLDLDKLQPGFIDQEYLENYLDKKMWSKDGKEFLGFESYNFGPQQLMDKQTSTANFPVQLGNSILVNAAINGNLDTAHEIQQLIADQERENLSEYLQELRTGSMAEYQKLIMEGLNKEDMDQAQRILLDDNGSLSHPYVTDIVVNQLAKSIRRKGNKLSTAGTYAHQKPDIGYSIPAELQINGQRRLEDYSENNDGTLSPMGSVLPKHMEGKHQARKAYLLSGNDIAFDNNTTVEERMNRLKLIAIKAAKLRAVREGLPKEQYFRFMAESKNANGGVQGYIVKGESVLMTRVPGHGPASTGVFEVVGFDKGEGNQVMVPSEFNDIVGADNDGDALFVQTRDAKQPKWNEAFQKIKTLWLSKGMNEQIRTQMDFVDQTEAIVSEIKKDLKEDKDTDYVMPFSPIARMKDYNNTMVSKRLVGVVFNIHKMANLLATYETNVKKPIQINGIKYDKFSDSVNGQESRNQKSATVANIILDNAKYGFADDLGLNEHTTAQATLMVNMGIPLKDIGMILNSNVARMYTSLNKNNGSLFHDSKSKKAIISSLKTAFGVDPKAETQLVLNTADINNKSNDGAIIEILSHMADVNTDVQKVSAIMSGHNKIHVNPFALETQIHEAQKVLGNYEGSSLEINDKLKTNPELQRYLDVAEATLRHTRRINPVYRKSTEKILDRLNTKIDDRMSVSQIERFSADILKFTTSRLLGHNNLDKNYVSELMDPKSSNSIFAKLNVFLNSQGSGLRNQILKVDGDNVINSVSGTDNSYLFSKALNYSLSGNTHFISANPSFVNDSLSDLERQQVQKEFQELPTDLRDDLILYDLIKNGWKGTYSIAPFFGEETNFVLNSTANDEFENKNDEIKENVLRKVEKIIAIKKSLDSNNPFQKIYLDKNNKVDNKEAVLKSIRKNTTLANKLGRGKPFYLNVRNGDQTALYEFEGFTKPEIAQIKNRELTAIEILSERLTHIPTVQGHDYNIDLATISDKDTTAPFKTYPYSSNDSNLDSIVEASINYEEVMEKLRASKGVVKGMDAREDYDSAVFESLMPLTKKQFVTANEFAKNVSERARESAYNKYLANKSKANQVAKDINYESVQNYAIDELLDMYTTYGEKDAYAYSIVMTPIIKELAQLVSQHQSKITKRQENGKDIDASKAWMMTGSTIPSNHPASQAVARIMEGEYKKFLSERRTLMKDKKVIVDALYKEKLGYGSAGSNLLKRGINTARRLVTSIFVKRADVYQRLYGNLTIRKESVDDNGKVTVDFKLRPKNDIESDFRNGLVSQAEYDFYNFFRETTDKLQPKDLKQVKQDYIPHTAMSNMEALSSRGLLGFMVNAKKEEQRIYDVRLNVDGESVDFKTIEDGFKSVASGQGKNSINNILEYRKLKAKATKLAAEGKNEDGTALKYSSVELETALGFGAVNRFANNRSVKATEMPSMDLDKALSDYIHSTVFVNGYGDFKGMKSLQGIVDGVIAHNRASGFDNVNIHVQKVWKDFFIKNKKQDSVLGKNADKVIRAMTKLNVLYGLGIQGGIMGGGVYAIGNIIVGKYNNIKDIGGKAFLKGEARYWGLDKGIQGGNLFEVNRRRKRMARIMKNINFMDNNVYDDVSVEDSKGLDSLFTTMALAPMTISEDWIQKVHMLGLMDEDVLDKFDEEGNYKDKTFAIEEDYISELEDRVRSQHGRGYNEVDQRAIQMYSWGNMALQYSKFIPTMLHDRFAKEDVNIYGKKHIGSLRAVSDQVRRVINDPKGGMAYYKSLPKDEQRRVISGLNGLGMSAIIAMLSGAGSTRAGDLFWDANYYLDVERLGKKMVPSAIQTTSNLVSGIF